MTTLGKSTTFGPSVVYLGVLVDIWLYRQLGINPRKVVILRIRSKMTNMAVGGENDDPSFQIDEKVK